VGDEFWRKAALHVVPLLTTEWSLLLHVVIDDLVIPFAVYTSQTPSTLNGPDNPQNYPFPWRDLDSLQYMVPWDQPSQPRNSILISFCRQIRVTNTQIDSGNRPRLSHRSVVVERECACCMFVCFCFCMFFIGLCRRCVACRAILSVPLILTGFSPVWKWRTHRSISTFFSRNPMHLRSSRTAVPFFWTTSKILVCDGCYRCNTRTLLLPQFHVKVFK